MAAKKSAQAAKKVAVKKAVRGPAVGKARTYTRSQVAKAWPSITETFVGLAKDGSCSHASFLVKMSGMDVEPVPVMKRRRGKSLKDELLG